MKARVADFKFILLALMLAAVALRSSAAPPAGYYQVWGDEFNGTSLDTNKWDYWLLGRRREAVNVTNAVSCDGSNLVIATYTSGGVNYTAMVATDQTFRTKYGYWESSIKWSDTNGMWSAVWMQSPTMGANLHDPATSGSELDFAEHRYVDGTGANIANQVQNNIHWNGYGAAAASAGSGNIGSGLAEGYHTYGFLWTPALYTLYVDGSNLRSWNFANNRVPISNSTEWIIFSSEVDDSSTTWAGFIPSGGYGPLGTSTARLLVDYCRYYAPTNTLFWTGANSHFLTDAANWVDSMPLTSASDLTFSFLSGSNLAPVLGANLAIDGLTVLELNHGLSISSNTLTIGAGGIDTISANHPVNLNSTINLGAAQTWEIGAACPVNVNGNLTGTNSLAKANAGVLCLNASNSFIGSMRIFSGTLRLGNAHALQASTLNLDASDSGTLSFGALTNATVAALTGSRNLVLANAANAAVVLSISSRAANSFAGILSGHGGLVKSGASTEILSGANNFCGTTTVSNGALIVNGALGTNAVTVTGGKLGGVGVISGAVNIQAGGTLAPGSNAIGALTISNTLTLGGTCFIEINQALKTNDVVRGLSTVNFGGTLTVNNLSGAPTAGDSFNIFQAASYHGAFTAFNLPPLGAGLAWNTANLKVDGTLSVVATVAP
jgi:autotransporter-associated beta strand protein